MDNETPELIEQQMQDTRQSLTDKVAALEQQVVGTLQDTTTAVQDTVQSLKSAVEDTVSSVKDSVSNTVTNVGNEVRSALDVSHHVRQNPWAMVGGAAALGFFAGALFLRGNRKERQFEAPRAYAAPIATAAAVQKSPGMLDKLWERVSDELTRMGEEALTKATEAVKKNLDETIPHFIDQAAARLQPSPAADPDAFVEPSSLPPYMQERRSGISRSFGN